MSLVCWVLVGITCFIRAFWFIGKTKGPLPTKRLGNFFESPPSDHPYRCTILRSPNHTVGLARRFGMQDKPDHAGLIQERSKTAQIPNDVKKKVSVFLLFVEFGCFLFLKHVIRDPCVCDVPLISTYPTYLLYTYYMPTLVYMTYLWRHTFGYTLTTRW